MKDILDRIADSSANESSHELICRLRDCAHEIEALRSALACRPDAQADERYDLLQAAVNCPHEIESNRVVLHYSDKQPGHNALAQLRERLTRAAAPQAEAAQGVPEGWNLVPIKPTAWRPGSETPPVKEGKAQEFILAVRRKHASEKVFVFAANYANNFTDDESLSGRDGEDFTAHGWYLCGLDTSGEFDEVYEAITLNEGDEILGWQPLPKWQEVPAAAPAPVSEPSPDREQVGEAILGSPAFALRGLYKLATEYFIDGKPATPDEYIAWQRGIIEALTNSKIPDPKYYGTQDEDGAQHEVKCAYVDGWNGCRASILAKDASPSRECGKRQGAALSNEQARTVECADSWLRVQGLQTYTDLRDTLFAVLRVIGYTEEFAEAHPDLKVSEGVKLFLALQRGAIECQAHIGPDCTECGGTGFWGDSTPATQSYAKPSSAAEGPNER